MYFYKLADVNLLVVLIREYLGHQSVHEKLKFLFVLFSSREYQKWLLEKSNLGLMWLSILEVIKLILSENVNLCSRSSFTIVYSSCDVFNVLDDEINWNPVVSETWNYDISVNHCWLNEVFKGILYEFVVLQQHILNSSAPFANVSF